MITLCPYCGKPVEEGQACACRQNPPTDTAVKTASALEEGFSENTTDESNHSIAGECNADMNRADDKNAAPDGAGNKDVASDPDGANDKAAVSDADGTNDKAAVSDADGDRGTTTASDSDSTTAQATTSDTAPNPDHALSGNSTLKDTLQSAISNIDKEKVQEQLSQATEQISATTKSIFARIVPLFQDPVGQTKEIADTNNKKTGLEMIISNIIVTMLIAIITMIYTRIKLGDYAAYIDIPYIRIVLVATLFAAITYALLTGLLYTCTKYLFHAETGLEKILSITGTKALIDICIFAVGIVLSILSIKLGAFVVLIGGIYSLLVMIFSFDRIIQIDTNQKIYSLFLTFLGFGLFYYLVYEAVIQKIVSVFSSLL